MSIRFNIYARNSTILQGQIRKLDGTLATQADVSAVGVYVYDSDDNGTLVWSKEDYAVADVIIDAPDGEDLRWTLDDTGANVVIVLPPAAFPDQGNYRVELAVDMVNGQRIVQAYDGPAKKIHTATPA